MNVLAYVFPSSCRFESLLIDVPLRCVYRYGQYAKEREQDERERAAKSAQESKQEQKKS
jgi:hypothetical protein